MKTIVTGGSGLVGNALKKILPTAHYPTRNDVNLLKEYEVFSENSGDQTGRVANKKPNDFGLYDMHGNVSEWVQDLDI